jgi:multiple sugar transport system permease protein
MRPRPIHYLMISPVQLMLIGMIFLPSLYVGWLSLQKSSFGQAAQFVGLGNYLQLLADPYFWRALLNTVAIVNIIVYGELLLGLGIGLLFAGGIPWPRLMLSIVLAPYAISEVVAVVMWKYMFEPQVGLANFALRGIGLPELEWAVNPVHGLALVTLLAVWHHLPFTFIILYTARLGIPRELYEAAVIDGSGPVQCFRHVTLRLLMPAILTALLFRYIFAFRMFSEVWLLTQGGPARTTEVLAVYLYKAAFRYHEFGLASATGWAMVVLSLLIALWYMRVAYRRMFAHEP